MAWSIVTKLFAQLRLLRVKDERSELLVCLHSVLIYDDSDARNVPMGCFRSVDTWYRDSHTVMHTDHLNFVVVVVLWFFPSSGMYAVLFIYLLYSAYLH